MCGGNATFEMLSMRERTACMFSTEYGFGWVFIILVIFAIMFMLIKITQKKGSKNE